MQQKTIINFCLILLFSIVFNNRVRPLTTVNQDIDKYQFATIYCIFIVIPLLFYCFSLLFFKIQIIPKKCKFYMEKLKCLLRYIEPIQYISFVK